MPANLTLDLDKDLGKRARAFKTTAKKLLRRSKSEAVLADILPAKLEAPWSYHVISHGDVDSMSYLAHVLKAQPLDYLMISTWVMAATDAVLIEKWVDEGYLIGRIDFHFGEHMAAEYGDIFKPCAEIADYTGGRATIARNHSKVMLMANAADDFWCVAESSANFNTNPRIEQTALHCDRDLFDFYRDFYDDLKSINRKTRASPKPSLPAATA